MTKDPLEKQRKEFNEVVWPQYLRDFDEWKRGDKKTAPPPRPVPPHIPGPIYPRWNW